MQLDSHKMIVKTEVQLWSIRILLSRQVKI